MNSIRIIVGDCREVLKTLPDASVNSVVCDPPYELTAKRPGGRSEATRDAVMGGFMGLKWDGTGVAFDVAMWAECLRVLKPGGHLLAFGGTRTQHRMVCAIEDAGFEIRDSVLNIIAGDERMQRFMASLTDEQVRAFAHAIEDANGGSLAAWGFGSGFPKSRDVSLAIDKAAGATREVVGQRTDGRYAYEFSDAAKKALGGVVAAASDTGFSGAIGQITEPSTEAAKQWEGWGTALKPAHEPICMARKPLTKGMTVAANVLAHGTGAINIDACRVPVDDESYARNFSGDRGHDGPRNEGETGATNMRMGGGTRRLIQARLNEESDANRNAFSKGLAGSVAAGETSLGRWPANLLTDGSPEVVALFPQSAGQQAFVGAKHGERPSINAFGDYGPRPDTPPRGDSGSAARFFWCSKTSSADRHDGLQHPGPQFTRGSTLRAAENLDGKGNGHPTVKPTKLMQYLVRLITPPGGTVLDPFMGSGSTLKAAELEGFNAIGIELSEDYAAIARRRIGSDAPLFSQVTE